MTKDHNVRVAIEYIGQMMYQHAMTPEQRAELPSAAKLVAAENPNLRQQVLDATTASVLQAVSARQRRDVRMAVDGAKEVGRQVAQGLIGLYGGEPEQPIVDNDDAVGSKSVKAQAAVQKAVREVVTTALAEAHVALMDAKAQKVAIDSVTPATDDDLWRCVRAAALRVGQLESVALYVWRHFNQRDFKTIAQLLGAINSDMNKRRDKATSSRSPKLVSELFAAFGCKDWQTTGRGAVFQSLFDEIWPAAGTAKSAATGGARKRVASADESSSDQDAPDGVEDDMSRAAEDTSKRARSDEQQQQPQQLLLEEARERADSGASSAIAQPAHLPQDAARAATERTNAYELLSDAERDLVGKRGEVNMHFANDIASILRNGSKRIAKKRHVYE